MTVGVAPTAATTTGLPDGLADDVAAAALLLARRLHAGGTLWCVSPAWPHHAAHVAVEFVHPVTVGKPALPAVALPPHDLTAAVRAHARAGDVLLLVARADDARALDLVHRAPAWGAEVLWVGTGPRPTAGAADHVLWLPDGDAAVFDGRLILLYHLLWELAHVCLESAALLAPAPCEGPVCVTCSDEGRLGEVVSVDGPTARVTVGGVVEDVDLTLVGSAAPHDLVVVHAGTAITRVDPAEAGGPS